MAKNTQKHDIISVLTYAAMFILLFAIIFLCFRPVSADCGTARPGNHKPDVMFGEIDDSAPVCDTITDEQRLDALIMAFAWVESGCNPDAYNAKERAAGDLQERHIIIDECNRILSLTNPDATPIEYSDAFDPDISHYVFEVVQSYHNPTFDVDNACKVWNPGCSKAYREEIKKVFNENMALWR